MSSPPPPRHDTDAPPKTVLADRRRPGRIVTTNPHLIALMRGAGGAGPARGIGLAVGIGMLLWVLIAAVAVLV